MKKYHWIKWLRLSYHNLKRERKEQKVQTRHRKLKILKEVLTHNLVIIQTKGKKRLYSIIFSYWMSSDSLMPSFKCTDLTLQQMVSNMELKNYVNFLDSTKSQIWASLWLFQLSGYSYQVSLNLIRLNLKIRRTHIQFTLMVLHMLVL